MHFRHRKLFTVTFGNLSFLVTQSTESTFYVDTALKLIEYTTDIECITKRVISAVPGNFCKIECSASYQTKLAKCTTRMEITIRLVTWAVYKNFRKYKFPSDP